MNKEPSDLVPQIPAHHVGRGNGLELLPAALSDGRIDEIAAAIHGIVARSTLELARSVGGIILNSCYGGDLSTWRARGAKDASFRKLAGRADAGELPLSGAGLYRSVALIELESRIGVSTWKHLSLSHVRLVFGLPEPDQKRLLVQAEEEGWTVRRLESLADESRIRLKDARGRPREPAVLKSLRRLGRFLNEDGVCLSDVNLLDALNGHAALTLYRTAESIRLRCEEIQSKLAPRVLDPG